MDRPGGLDIPLGELAHFGVKGMKWGVRRKPRIATKVTVSTGPGGQIRTTGGKNQKPSPDAVKAARLKQRAKKSTTKSLSNAELKALINRMQLEKQFSDLQGDNAVRKGVKIVRELVSAGQLAKTIVGEVQSARKK